MYDLIIIGGGPAGISAGIYAARKKIKTLILTKDFIGQVGKTSEVDNYPGFPGISGIDLIKKFEKHLRKFEIEISLGEVIKVNRNGENFLIKVKGGKEFLAKTIIIATGRDPRPLEVPGEKEFIGRGVSYCSTCDGPFFKDKAVAIIGGGNSGFEAVLDLIPYAKRIFVFEQSDKIMADEILRERVKKESKIQIHLNKKIKKIEGDGKVQDMIYQDTKTSKTFQVPIDGIFIEIGSIPATGFLKGVVDPHTKFGVGVKFNKNDEIKVDLETCSTSCPGIFAAGDVNNGKWKQIVIAAGEGSRAALAVYEYLQKNN